MSNRESRITSHGFFITGTDTGVGKTMVTAALLAALRADRVDAVAMKPVQTGAVRGRFRGPSCAGLRKFMRRDLRWRAVWR